MPRGYNYRAEVRKLIPQLQVLDEVPAAHTGLPASWKLDQDWLMVKEAIKEAGVFDGLLPGLGMPAIHPPSGKGHPPSLETLPTEPQKRGHPHHPQGESSVPWLPQASRDGRPHFLPLPGFTLGLPEPGITSP